MAKKRNTERTNLGNILGTPSGGFAKIPGAPNASGLGVNSKNNKPATGTRPTVNPFLQPKSAGLNITSQTFLNNYYQNWDLTAWRAAADACIKNGNPPQWAALVSWVFECSPFVQSLFRQIAVEVGKVPFMYTDEKGNELPEWTDELCSKQWCKSLRLEIVFAFFWGFSGLNIDPIGKQIYKYPMQDLDPISRMLRQNTFSYNDGMLFSESPSLIWIQPSTSYERFLGLMQPIARSFILINLNKINQVQAGKRLAYPVLSVGYSQNDGGIDQYGNNINSLKGQAEDIAANIDPSKGIVYPFTRGINGEPEKQISIEFEKTGANNKAHSVYSDFNKDEKDEIREMILGGTLTSSVSGLGSRALGEVHADKFESVILDFIDYVEEFLNDEFKAKISQFYTNFPSGKFIANKAKQLSLDQIQILSNVITQNNKQLSASFFEAQGILPEFLEDAPDQSETKQPVKDPAEKSASKKKLF